MYSNLLVDILIIISDIEIKLSKQHYVSPYELGYLSGMKNVYELIKAKDQKEKDK